VDYNDDGAYTPGGRGICQTPVSLSNCTAAGFEEEYFDFNNFGADGDYSTGKFVVSIYYADYTDDDTAVAHVEVTKADGTTSEVAEAPMDFLDDDQWHAFEIDAATGNITMIDEFVDYVTE
jgi:hypothetical protein